MMLASRGMETTPDPDHVQLRSHPAVIARYLDVQELREVPMTITYVLIQTCEDCHNVLMSITYVLFQICQSRLCVPMEKEVSGTMEKTAQMVSTAPMVVTGMMFMTARMVKKEQKETILSTALMVRTEKIILTMLHPPHAQSVAG